MSQVSRRMVLAMGAVALTSACEAVATSDGPDEGPLRAETEPLEKRFPQLGPLSDAHWLGYDLVKNNDGRSVPGPSDIRVVGVARLADGTVERLLSVTTRDFRPDAPVDVPGRLAAHVPDGAGWVHSKSFDSEISKNAYTGRFLLSAAEGLVWFDAVDPTVPAAAS
ncbi:hypothetical protein ACWGJT_05370 [Streptomyces xantholiticus]